MNKINNELYVLIAGLVGLVCTTVLIALGHNHIITTLFAALNGSALGLGGYKILRKGKDDGQKKEEDHES